MTMTAVAGLLVGRAALGGLTIDDGAREEGEGLEFDVRASEAGEGGQVARVDRPRNSRRHWLYEHPYPTSGAFGLMSRVIMVSLEP
ncbi:hypothetical protein D9611_011813 [Ephemerocybe angulata]|uniref:Uncharacterized protein n=1 Tax=Ephemerocybe angulata TaxID=980116 RepID=A0A8H5BZP9_9AGAR|nr:hypothetical protein D9611_011813 [Tulosesus angulatus]